MPSLSRGGARNHLTPSSPRATYRRLAYLNISMTKKEAISSPQALTTAKVIFYSTYRSFSQEKDRGFTDPRG